MAREFKLPDIGEGVHEGEVVKWFVKEGDAVKENDPIVEVMTDKVTVQIPSPVTGKILQLRAKELNVNLAAIRGSGPQGRLTEDDVRKAAQAPPRVAAAVPVPAAAVAPTAGEQRIPIHGLRKRIFEKMAKSNATAAHFTYVEEVDMTQLVHLRDHLKPTAERKGVKLTFLPFFAKAVLAALVEFPTLNSSVDDDRGEIVLK